MKSGEFQDIDGLILHLNNSGISIEGNYDKNELTNFGYYHGYKAY